MKILKISFKNINSLRGKQEIDFTKDPFLRNNLFAITGPTGSGKTTILDVISLALFNQVPRLGKLSTTEVLKKGAILTRNQKEAYAAVKYQCKTGVFVSKWEISTARTGNLREYHMELKSDESGHIDLKKSDVPAKNEELIGLSYDQFIKSVVLAQGEFAKFLKVSKKERGALLEKITGTQIYRQLGQEAYLKFKEINAKIEEKRLKIDTHKEQLLDETLFTEKQQLAEKLKLERKNLRLSLENNTEALQLKEKLQQQQQELRQTTSQIDHVAKETEIFKQEKGLRLKQHEEIQLFAEALNEWEKLEENKREKASEIASTQEKLEALQAKAASLQNEFAAHFQLKINVENAAEKLAQYKQDVRKRINDKNEIASTYRTSARHIESLAEPFQLASKPAKIDDFLVEIDEKRQENARFYQVLSEKFQLKNNTTSEQQQRIRSQLKETRLAEKEELQLLQLKKEYKKQRKALDEIENSLHRLPENLAALQQKLQLKEAQLEAKQKSLEVKQLQKKLEDYRKELVNQQPCPLCGSLHHPYAENLPKTANNLNLEVKKLQEISADLRKNVVQKETQLQQYVAQRETLNKEVASQAKDIELREANFQQQFKTLLQRKKTGFTEMEQVLEQQLEELEKAAQWSESLEQLEKLETQGQKLKVLIEKGSRKSEEIKALFKGTDFESEIGQAETSWNHTLQNISQNKQLLKDMREQKSILTTKLEQLDESLIANLQEKGYESIKQALKLRLPAASAQTWQHEREELQNKTVKLKTLQQRLNEEIAQLEKKDVTESLSDLKEKIQQQQKNLHENEATFNNVSRLIENQKERLKVIKDLQKEVGSTLEQLEHWKVLNDLIGDATGNKFNDFAQDLTLAQLLQLANKRLSLLSDRYRIDQPTNEEDDSLMAIDAHMGGQRRSIKTLSGGETFILSLSMALALSDLASRNVEINSLFIDEGFGTLDPETLDQTLDTLERLQAESSKTIGIISHVDALKERIATQIQLSRNGQGYSSLQVV